MRRRLSVCLSVVLLAALAACTADPDARPGESLLVTDRLPQTLDPAGPLSASFLRGLGVGEALFKIKPDGGVAPELADSSTQDTPRRWTVRLREGIRFASGRQVDAQAVRDSLERTRKLDELGKPFLAGVRIQVVDRRTVRFDTAEPRPSFPYALAHYQLTIHDAKAYGDRINASDVARANLTGPLEVASFSPDSMVLRRNPNYWGEPVGFRRLTVRAVSDDQSRAQAARSGQAQIVLDIPFDAARTLKQAPGVRVLAEPAANTNAIYLNPRSTKAPALADRRVRQALAWGLDRKQLVRLATGGLSEPAPSWLASNPAFPEAKRTGFSYDPRRAARLLDEAGWRKGADGMRSKNGEPLGFRLWTWGTEQPLGEVAQEQWRKLGVAVELNHLDQSVLKESRGNGDWDAFTEAWTTVGELPSLLSTQVAPGGSGNYAKLSDPAMTAALGELNGAQRPEDVRRAALRVNREMNDLVPSIPTGPRVDVNAVSDRVTGFVPHPLQYENVIQPGMRLR